jgi:hypothetical protein
MKWKGHVNARNTIEHLYNLLIGKPEAKGTHGKKEIRMEYYTAATVKLMTLGWTVHVECIGKKRNVYNFRTVRPEKNISVGQCRHR